VDTNHLEGHPAMTSLDFAPVGSHDAHTTSLGDGYKVKAMSHTNDTIDLEKGKDDAGSIKSNSRPNAGTGHSR
jgi:hypothetical protein